MHGLTRALAALSRRRSPPLPPPPKDPALAPCRAPPRRPSRRRGISRRCFVNGRRQRREERRAQQQQHRRRRRRRQPVASARRCRCRRCHHPADGQLHLALAAHVKPQLHGVPRGELRAAPPRHGAARVAHGRCGQRRAADGRRHNQRLRRLARCAAGAIGWRRQLAAPRDAHRQHAKLGGGAGRAACCRPRRRPRLRRRRQQRRTRAARERRRRDAQPAGDAAASRRRPCQRQRRPQQWPRRQRAQRVARAARRAARRRRRNGCKARRARSAGIVCWVPHVQAMATTHTPPRDPCSRYSHACTAAAMGACALGRRGRASGDASTAGWARLRAKLELAAGSLAQAPAVAH
jgi:hypothetical protein